MPKHTSKRKPNPYLLAFAGVILVALGLCAGYAYAKRQPIACGCMCLVPQQIN